MKMTVTRRTLALATIAGLAFGASVQPSSAGDADLINTLRAGGNVILVRHGATFSNQADTDPLHLENVAAQRKLNEKGQALAKGFGEALRSAAIPVGSVETSKFDRAYQTAVMAGFKDITTSVDISEGGLVVTTDENNRRAAALRKLLGATPATGTNTVLITHRPNILDALGKDFFDVQEGEASVFRPENGSYRLVARLRMEDWPGITASVN
jgi:broad specificity phosphatase PhoE